VSTNSKEVLFASISGALAVAAIVSMPWLVAKPKVLFGRSLTAIPPSLFPYVALSLTVLFSALLILKTDTSRTNESGNLDHYATNDWAKKAGFFILLTGYGLLLKPIGFLLSSALAIALTSLLLGNRNWLQIALIAVLAPVCLYLIATRGMLVSLPELNSIELFYAQVINQVQAVIKP